MVLFALFFAALVLSDSYLRFFATLFFEACYWTLNNVVVLDRPMPPALENAVKTLRWSNPLIVVDLLGSLVWISIVASMALEAENKTWEWLQGGGRRIDM